MLPPHLFSPSVLFLFCVFLFASARRWRNGVSLQKCFRALLSARHEAYEWHRRSFGCVCVCLAQKRMGENARGVGRPRGKVSVTTQYIKPFSHNRIMIPTNRMIFWRIGILEYSTSFIDLLISFFFFSFLIHRSFIHCLFLIVFFFSLYRQITECKFSSVHESSIPLWRRFMHSHQFRVRWRARLSGPIRRKSKGM